MYKPGCCLAHCQHSAGQQRAASYSGNNVFCFSPHQQTGKQSRRAYERWRTGLLHECNECLQGNGAMAMAAAKPRQKDGTPEIDIPWSVNAPYEPEEFNSQDHEDQMSELGPEGMEFVPYCVMPYVERLLKVCLTFAKLACFLSKRCLRLCAAAAPCLGLAPC